MVSTEDQFFIVSFILFESNARVYFVYSPHKIILNFINLQSSVKKKSSLRDKGNCYSSNADTCKLILIFYLNNSRLSSRTHFTTPLCNISGVLFQMYMHEIDFESHIIFFVCLACRNSCFKVWQTIPFNFFTVTTATASCSSTLSSFTKNSTRWKMPWQIKKLKTCI